MLSRQNFHGLLAVASLFICPIVANAQVDKAELAKKAKTVLETHCYNCHGKAGRAEGTINYLLNREKLIEHHKVTPGSLTQSRLYKVMDKEIMPPETDTVTGKPITVRPSVAEIAIIKEWIEAGAPDFDPPAPKRSFISNLDVLKFIRQDLEKADENTQPLLRYFTLTHLYNAGLLEDELKSYRIGLSKLVNSLSWGRQIVVPLPIEGSEGTILRIKLTDYKWDEKTWERILAANPYGVTYKNENAGFCYRGTKCAIPHVRADWFVFAASRPPLYHDILNLPMTVQELEKLILPRGTTVADNIRLKDVVRAAFNDSGISSNNRLIERHDSSHGYYWKSYDFEKRREKKADGKEVDHPERNLFIHPLGPDGANAFQHGGGEMIFSLPNGLQGYYLSDAKGTRLNEGPIAIVKDIEQKDSRVVNGISCMKCHNLGIKEKPDEVRSYVEANPNAFGVNEKKIILALYKEKSELGKKYTEDMEQFRKAMEQTGAHLSKTAEPIYILAKLFDSNLDLKLAAAEVGVDVEAFKTGLSKSESLARQFGTLKAGGRVTRDDLVTGFGELVQVLDLAGQFQPSSDLARGKPKLGEEREFAIGELNGKKIPMVFCWVPSGKAKLGSPATEKDRSSDEAEHEFQTEGFWLAKYPVTQEQWEAVMKSNPSTFDGKKDNKAKGLDTSRFPVEAISWEDCQTFIVKLNDRGGVAGVFGDSGKFALPHEDEWEYACRGGKGNKSPFYWGDELNGILANCNGKYPYGTATEGPYLERTTKVGSYEAKAPHPWGLCDMSGNIYQWCENKYDANGSVRVIRGGSWFSGAWLCRSARRRGDSPDDRSNDLGFRVALVPSGQ
jgi:formylglycine-generating enzyme required for sulfatase activity